jgi:segregation and condensation protein B
MDYFGINTSDDLPKIKEILAEQAVEATYINGAAAPLAQEPSEGELPIDETSSEFFAVTPDGELITASEEESHHEAGGDQEEDSNHEEEANPSEE